jgi:AhpD family alkylhydroperoxidase
MAHNHDLLKEVTVAARDLRAHIGDVYAGFSQMHTAALAEGVLDTVTKELIALGMSIGNQCDGCIASHAKGAARQGATDEQVAETIGVAIMMTGGPGTIYGPRAWAAFKEFSSPAG